MSNKNDVFEVTVPQVNLFVGPRIPRTLAVILAILPKRSMIRIAGAMNNDPAQIYPFFETALAGIDGTFLWSGATRMIEEGGYAASVAEVVARTGKQLPNLFTGGSCPRTSRLTIRDDSHLTLGDNTIVNPETQFVSIIQPGPEDTDALSWDGDVDQYLEFMVTAREELGFNLGMIVWSGGGVTVKEVKKAASFGIPIFVISGSGREADNSLNPENFKGNNIFHVSINNPEILRKLLIENKLSI